MHSMQGERERDPERERERERERAREPERELGMQQKHRQHIMRNMERLIESTDYEKLKKETVRRGLISQTMLRNIEDLNGRQLSMSEEAATREMHIRYFEKITKRGPTAYAEEKAILRKLGFYDALDVLDEVDQENNQAPFVSLSRMHSNKSTDIVDNRVAHISRNGPSVSLPIETETFPLEEPDNFSNSDGPLEPFTGPIAGQTRTVIKSTRIHTDDVLGTYPMKSQHKRGVLLIVNIVDFTDPKIKRNGAEGDGDSLIHIFREIGFEIFTYKNLTCAQFRNKLTALTNSEFVRETECFVMVLMTHGERVAEVDRVQFSDGAFETVRSIINHFQPNNCPNLVHKPKVLIFPFCRGEKPDQGQVVRSRIMRKPTQTDGFAYDNVPTLSDILVCYASTPGYETHRDPDEGSWYIQKFCDAMADHAHNTSLEDILKKTNTMVGNMRTFHGHLQTGAFDNLGFNKKLFFNPGIFSE